MAEIALALAMGFFSVMVLALVSMGAGEVLEPDPASEPPPRIEALVVRPAAANTSASTRPPPTRDRIVVYHAGELLDASLQPVEPGSLLPDEAGGEPIVLAIAPDLPLEEVMSARRRIQRGDVVIATLDDRWLKALERRTR